MEFGGELRGTEHVVEFDESSGDVVKLTIPPGFGLTPELVSHPVVTAAEGTSDAAVRHAIEFRKGSPLEYLERWLCSNEVFEDDVRLASVVSWADGSVSFSIRQPQYDGEVTSQVEIEDFFVAAGWIKLDREKEHAIYFNYAFQVMAIDALPRNCYKREGRILPFDVILCRPSEAIESYLEIYPS